MNQEYLQLYADFIVKVGVNVRPRQNFIIRCPVTMPEFAHACAKAGYEAGAKEVIVPLGRRAPGTDAAGIRPGSRPLRPQAV